MSFGFSYYIPFFLLFQPGGRESKTVPMSPDGEGEDAESPMPHPSQFGGKEKRRGAVSAEPITEEDITAYVKKVFTYFYLAIFCVVIPPWSKGFTHIGYVILVKRLFINFKVFSVMPNLGVQFFQIF